MFVDRKETYMRHLIDITDFSVQEIEAILDLGDKMIADPAAYSECLQGKILATLFSSPPPAPASPSSRLC